jgi:hypothetical protein
VSYCHHFSSVVRPSTFHMLIFSSETTGPIATKLLWNGPWWPPSKFVFGDPDFQPRLSSAVGAILVEGLHGRTYFWKGTNQWLFHQNLVSIVQIVSDTLLEGDHPRIISAKFGWDCLSSFRGEDFFLISSPFFSILSLTDFLVGSRDHRTQIWKGATKDHW